MQPLLLDKGLPWVVAKAFVQLGLEANAVGHSGAPAQDSADDVNCRWCVEQGAVLVTNDRGKKDRAILLALDEHHVHAIFVHRDLQSGKPYRLARALLSAEGKMDEVANGRRLLRHRLQPGGGLQKR